MLRYSYSVMFRGSRVRALGSANIDAVPSHRHERVYGWSSHGSLVGSSPVNYTRLSVYHVSSTSATALHLIQSGLA